MTLPRLSELAECVVRRVYRLSVESTSGEQKGWAMSTSLCDELICEGTAQCAQS